MPKTAKYRGPSTRRGFCFALNERKEMAKLTGFTGDLFSQMLIGSGAVLLDPPDETLATLMAGFQNSDPNVIENGEKLGATSGGISVETETENIDLGDDVDGLSVALRGAMVLDSEAVTLTTNVMEFVPGRISKLNPRAVRSDLMDSDGTTIVGDQYDVRGYYEDADYFDRVVVGLESRNKAVRIAIVLFNCLITGGMSIETNDDQTPIQVPFEVTAMADESRRDPETGSYFTPMKILDFSTQPAPAA